MAVRVTAPPEGGKANAAVQKVVASALGLPKSSVKVVRGQTARVKALEIDGIDESGIRKVFGEPEQSLW